MHTDPIADMLTRLRNADRAGHRDVRMPYSKIKHAILTVMVESKMIEAVKLEKSGKFQELHVTLLSNRPQPLHLKRLSKPGQRIYVASTQIPSVMNGMGIAILSTPKGIMSNRTAKKEKVGGELVCEIA